MKYRHGAASLVLLAVGLATAQAQQIQRAVHEEEAPPIQRPATPLTLDQCLDLGMQHQPSLDAARASLSAAQTGQRALDRLLIPRLFAKDLPVRREQACLGVGVASASLSQAEIETRYAITRNFYTVQYVHAQQIVIGDVLKSLKDGRDRAQRLFKTGNVQIKITQLDIDALDIQYALVQTKKHQADNGMLKAMAALREAMGLSCDQDVQIAAVGLPQEVYVKKTTITETVMEEKTDKDGKVVKDKDGKVEMVQKTVKKDVTTYHRLYNLNKQELIELGLANRAEITQANLASRVVSLEIDAQGRIRGYKGGTFAQGADLHVMPVPLMRQNGDYSPGASAIEMPTLLAGRKHDRMARASDFSARAAAVVDKTTSLVSLDVEAQYLKWLEAAEDIEDLSAIYKLATELPDRAKNLDPLDFTAQAVINANMGAVTVRTQLNEARHNHALALAGLERATGGAYRMLPAPTPPAK